MGEVNDEMNWYRLRVTPNVPNHISINPRASIFSNQGTYRCIRESKKVPRVCPTSRQICFFLTAIPRDNWPWRSQRQLVFYCQFRVLTEWMEMKILFYALLRFFSFLTTVTGVLKPPIIWLHSSVTIETRFASVYNTHVYAEHRRSQSWNEYLSTRSS